MINLAFMDTFIYFATVAEKFPFAFPLLILKDSQACNYSRVDVLPCTECVSIAGWNTAHHTAFRSCVRVEVDVLGSRP